MKAFISHSFEDAEKFQDFSDIFTREAIPLFRPLDMNGTRSLADQLREAIADCDVCIFLATHNSVHSTGAVPSWEHSGGPARPSSSMWPIRTSTWPHFHSSFRVICWSEA